MIHSTSQPVAREDLGEPLREYNASEEEFIALDVLPLRPVPKKSSTVSVLPRENMTLADTEHANGAHFNRIGLYTGEYTYKCVDHGLEDTVTEDDRENYASEFDCEIETVTNLDNKILMAQEVRAATLIFNTTTWTGDTLFTDHSAAPWATASTPVIAHVTGAKEKVRALTGFKPDSMVIGEVGLNNILANDDILARFPGATAITEKMLRDNLAAIFGLKNLFVGGKTYNGAAEGQTYSGTDIWSPSYAMVFKRNTGHLTSGGLGRTMLWTPLTATNTTVTSYGEPQSDSDVYRVRQFCVEGLFDPAYGHLMDIAA